MKKNNKTIGYDATWMRVTNVMGGGFQYAERLISAMVKFTDLNIVAVVSAGSESIFNNLKDFQNFKVVTFEDYGSLSDIISYEHVDLIHTPIQHYFNYTLIVPMITTLHDLQHCHFPQFFSKHEISFRNKYYRKAAEASERIIVSYGHVKEDIIKFYEIPSAKIDVCPIGVELPNFNNISNYSAVKTRYHLPAKYLFYAANTWQHKNHINLIKALKILHQKYGDRISLICTGHKYKDQFKQIKKSIESSGVRSFVKFLGYISEADKLSIMSHAELVVVPTLYEAGSFPLIEAMNYGIPVICSNVTSLPDQIQDKRYIFDPNNIDEMADKMNMMLTDKMARQMNTDNSHKIIREQLWEKRINYFVETYDRAIIDFQVRMQCPDLKRITSGAEFWFENSMRSVTSSRFWTITLPLRKIAHILRPKFL